MDSSAGRHPKRPRFNGATESEPSAASPAPRPRQVADPVVCAVPDSALSPCPGPGAVGSGGSVPLLAGSHQKPVAEQSAPPSPRYSKFKKDYEEKKAELLKKWESYKQGTFIDHPFYSREWSDWYKKRYSEVKGEGKDPKAYSYKAEWKTYWVHTRVPEIKDAELNTLRLKTLEAYGYDRMPESPPPPEAEGAPDLKAPSALEPAPEPAEQQTFARKLIAAMALVTSFRDHLPKYAEVLRVPHEAAVLAEVLDGDDECVRVAWTADTRKYLMCSRARLLGRVEIYYVPDERMPEALAAIKYWEEFLAEAESVPVSSGSGAPPVPEAGDGDVPGVILGVDVNEVAREGLNLPEDQRRDMIMRAVQTKKMNVKENAAEVRALIEAVDKARKQLEDKSKASPQPSPPLEEEWDLMQPADFAEKCLLPLKTFPKQVQSKVVAYFKGVASGDNSRAEAIRSALARLFNEKKQKMEKAVSPAKRVSNL